MYADADFHFKTDIKDVTEYWFNQFLEMPEADFNCTFQATVNWHIEFDLKDYGVRSMDVIIDSVEVEIVYTTETEHLSKQEKEKLIELKAVELRNGETEGELTISSDMEEWKIDNQIEIKSSISPESIEIDFKTKTLTVN